MKFIRTLLIAGLAISIVLNFMQYWKNERLKALFIVNGQKFTMKQYHDWLEQHYGLATQASMIRYYLVTDAAKKAGVMPSTAEVDQVVKDQEEADPTLALRFQREPWLQKDLTQAAELQLALLNLTTKGTKLTDEQLKTTYETFGPSAFDVPGKTYTIVIGSADRDPAQRAQYLKRAKDLLDGMAQRAKVEQPEPGVQQKVLPDISIIQGQLTPHIGLLYGDGHRVFKSTNPAYARLATLKVGDSAIMPDPQLGQVLVYVEKRVDGRKSSLSDPATRKKVEQQYKLMQGGGVLLQQKLRELWDAASIQTDPETRKAEIEPVLFPNRAAQKAGQ